MRRAAVTALAALALLLAAGPALGHAQYVSSSPPVNAVLPDAPASVTITTSEEVAIGSASIRVTNCTGVRVDVNGTRVSPSDTRVFAVDLAEATPGVYTVAWSSTSAVDGHFFASSFGFAVQDQNGTVPCGVLATPSPSATGPTPFEVALRFVALATLACAAGGVGLAALAVDPARRALTPKAAAAARDGMRILFLWSAGQAGAYCAFAAGWSAYAALAAPEGASSPFALSLAVRAGVGAALAVTLALAPRLTGGLTNEKRLRAVLVFALSLAAAAIALTSTTSHAAAAVDWRPWGQLIDFAHLSAATFWVGSLIGLVVLGRVVTGEGSARAMRAVLERFTRLAFFAVGTVLACGILLALIQVGSIDRLTTTVYGALVLAKASLFVPMAALGAHNHYRSIPSLADSAEAGLKRIARNVRAEAAMGLAVLLIAGTLTAISPAAPVNVPPSAYILTQKSGDVRIDFQVSPPPGFPGVYTLTFELWNSTTGAAVFAGNGTFELTLVNTTLPPQDVALQGPHGNHYFIENQNFGQPGTWRIDADFLRSGQPDIRTTFNIVITAP